MSITTDRVTSAPQLIRRKSQHNNSPTNKHQKKKTTNKIHTIKLELLSHTHTTITRHTPRNKFISTGSRILKTNKQKIPNYPDPDFDIKTLNEM